MTGLVWFVQIVHYPLMGKVGPREFVDYEIAHTNRTSIVVAPIMLLELFSGLLYLYFQGWPLEWLASFTVNMYLLGLIWLSTFFLQIPLHRHLSGGFDQRAHQRLVRTNWLRTLLWTVRSLLLVAIIF